MRKGSFRAVLLLAMSCALAACGEGIMCTMQIAFGMMVTVTDSTSGNLVLDSVVVTARDGIYADTGDLSGPFYFLAPERKGRYEVTVHAPSYRTWVRTGVQVTGDRCHVNTVHLDARLQQP